MSTIHFEGTPLIDTSPRQHGIPTVYKARTMKSYIQKEYKYVKSVGGTRFRDQLQTAAKNYGESMHEIRGNGDCLPSSFSTGLIYVMNGNSTLIEKFSKTLLTIDKTRIQEEVKTIMGVLGELKKGNLGYRDETLRNSDIMNAFSHIIRQMAHQKISKLYADFGTDEVNKTASATPGVNMGVECFDTLSKQLGLRTHVVVLQNNHNNYDLKKYPDDDSIPDIVIVRKSAHFVSIIPDRKRIQAQLNLKERAPLYKIEEVARNQITAPTQSSSLQTRKIEPQRTSSSKGVIFIALAVIIILGALLLKNYFSASTTPK